MNLNIISHTWVELNLQKGRRQGIFFRINKDILLDDLENEVLEIKGSSSIPLQNITLKQYRQLISGWNLCTCMSVGG